MTSPAQAQNGKSIIFLSIRPAQKCRVFVFLRPLSPSLPLLLLLLVVVSLSLLLLLLFPSSAKKYLPASFCFSLRC